MSKLDALIKHFNRHYKEDIAGQGIIRKDEEKIPFSSLRINYMLYGGLPRGRIIEFAGEENGGKTTTALDIVANAQKLFFDEWHKELKQLQKLDKPKKEDLARLEYLKTRGAKQVVYADCENTLDEDWAKLLGVNIDQVFILRPMSQTAEQIFEILLQMVETDEVGLVVIDSLGVMLSAQAYEKTMEEKTYGGIAAALTLFSKKAELLCSKYNCTLIGINQIRENMDSPYGGIITTGGRGWKHNCSVRLMFSKGQYLDSQGNPLKRSAEAPAGNEILVHIAKTKVCKPDRRVGFYYLMYDTGVNALIDIVDLAIKYDIINQGGSWFTFIDLKTRETIRDESDQVIKLQGRTSVIQYLENNNILLEEVKNQLFQLIF